MARTMPREKAAKLWDAQVDAIDQMLSHCNRKGIKTIRLAHYTDADLLRFVKPDEPEITLEIQQLLTFLTRDYLTQFGVKVILVPFDASKYLDWLARNSLPNNAHNRAGFVASQ